MLLKVHTENDTIPDTAKIATKAKKDKQYLQREGIQPSNFMESEKRVREKPTYYGFK
jgi:hypothetical protein